MKVVVTGSDGFIGKNLCLALERLEGVEVRKVVRSTSNPEFEEALREAAFVFHLAGVNRPKHQEEFRIGNLDLTAQLCKLLQKLGNRAPVVYSSTTQAELDNEYGKSKKLAEEQLISHAETSGSPVAIYRLTNVFGKWARPNYNSVVATFCNNIAQDLPIRVDDPSSEVSLVYIDDVVENFVELTKNPNWSGVRFVEISPVYSTTVGQIAETVRGFHRGRQDLTTAPVGVGLTRALYATYISYLEPEQFGYTVPMYKDDRGVFAELLKTNDSGQFSYFTAGPGITRGGHYHHSKTEKFVVLKGQARFRYRHVLTNEQYERFTSGEKAEVVETIPGWAHDITNVGSDELVVFLWANEVFDRERPDTYAEQVFDET